MSLFQKTYLPHQGKENVTLLVTHWEYPYHYVNSTIFHCLLLPQLSFLSVAKLQKSLGHQCGVASKDIILLTPKGHLLDAEETLGSYDAGTVSAKNLTPIDLRDCHFRRNDHFMFISDRG